MPGWRRTPNAPAPSLRVTVVSCGGGALRKALPPDEHALFRDLYQIMYADLPQPQLIVYLHLGIDRLRERIRQRGRGYEQAIGADYLMRLQERYMDHLMKAASTRALIVDLGDTDLLRDEAAFVRLLSLMDEEAPMGQRVASL